MDDCVALEKGQRERHRANRHLRTRHTLRLQLNVCTKSKCVCPDVLNKKTREKKISILYNVI